jgi:hypothetical protein
VDDLGVVERPVGRLELGGAAEVLDQLPGYIGVAGVRVLGEAMQVLYAHGHGSRARR